MDSFNMYKKNHFTCFNISLARLIKVQPIHVDGNLHKQGVSLGNVHILGKSWISKIITN